MSRVLSVVYLVVLSGLDIVTTHLALLNGAREGNPFASLVLNTWGEPFLYVFKMTTITAVVLLGMWRGLWLTFWVIDAVMMLVVLSNLSHL